MKTYQYDEPDYEDGKLINNRVTKTEDEIIETYWEWWKGKMKKANKPEELITHENCIRDWVHVHWAWEVE